MGTISIDPSEAKRPKKCREPRPPTPERVTVTADGRLDSHLHVEVPGAAMAVAAAPPPTEIFVPAHVGAVSVNVSGAAALMNTTRAPDGAHTVFVSPQAGGGTYEVRLKPIT